MNNKKKLYDVRYDLSRIKYAFVTYDPTYMINNLGYYERLLVKCILALQDEQVNVIVNEIIEENKNKQLVPGVLAWEATT